MAVTTQRRAAPMIHGGRQLRIPSHEHTHPPPRPRQRQRTMPLLRTLPTVLFFLVLASFLPRANAVFIDFESCLNKLFLDNDVPFLQFTPMYVWAAFDTHNPTHNLNVTVYGNVSGQSDRGTLPSPSDTSKWDNPNSTLFGKIEDVDKLSNHYTTLFSDFRTLTYSSWTPTGVQFCANVLNTTVSDCPMAPAFNANASDPYSLPGFTVAHDFHSTYAFSTWALELRIVSGDQRAYTLGCVSANITPDLGKRLSDAVCYMPAAVLILVGVATVFAATCSPWGTSNIFRWTSNYGRDEDLLRLVTPGFGDCLQYIQFIVLAGSLSLNYPGFFQPAISQASWSVLLFNESFVSKGNGSQSLDDGIYIVNGTYGLTRLGQYVGMTKERDMWACMAIFLLVLIAIVIVLTQVGFVGRWLMRMLTNTQDGDLTGKNWSFTAGNIVRIVFNFFMLPIIALSLFQLVVAPRSPGSVVGAAAVLLIGVMGIAFWIFWLIFTTRPRAHLFDDLPTVLTYGPLYNTYSDDAAPFAFIPVLLTIIRGIAIGAIQPSGIAQIVMLAICEVILILTLHAFRPFQSNTSMNAYHTFFSAVRLICILLSVAFVPTLGVAESSKGWIGYAILLLHAVVLIFGFFLNALQTIVEVIARLSGAGADTRGGLTKVFGKRQLSKRVNHRQQRSSLNSNAAMLVNDENKNIQLMDSRSRSLSASSAVLLSQPYDRDEQRRSGGFDFSSGEGNSPGTPGVNAMPFNFLGGSSGQSSRRPTMGTQLDTADPYYRPPRVRTNTMDSVGPGARGRGAPPPGSADIVDAPYSDQMDIEAAHDAGEGPSRASPAYLRMNRENDSDPNLERRNNTDYSVRESDFYYGLRGPALSSQPSRKLKTGPADPMSPVSSATGWFKNLNLLGGGRKKEKSKGFEVVRSTRMPPQMMAVEEQEEHEQSPRPTQEPYRDHPDSPESKKSQKSPPRAVAPAGVLAGESRRSPSSDSESDFSDEGDEEPFAYDSNRVSEIPPMLGPIETGGGIELPSRVGSRVSRTSRRGQPGGRAPILPRRSSRRTASTEAAILENNARLSRIMDSPPMPQSNQHLQPTGGTLPIRLPFGSTDPSPERSPGHSAASSAYRQALAPPPVLGGNGMVSTGYVQGHRTQDSFHSDGYDGADVEARAEIVGRSQSGSTQMSGQSRRSRPL
ncbi:hypothetical protein BU25DRAFT_237218 [Macroventuria anomochaeta]|uniref:Uncharacterized protein n=1 Tax=Macroventuria anomochaeta TaxID=301207 RepID=A0ACB6RJG3_9PLEO|nr:uncharacterized protein BU25DRAFT_237218 [Macroventuria anomochaeta]KAF2621550.1 hypothetical protein BU25DRAFT_237218 [Macroventuria anomochaeta]